MDLNKNQSRIYSNTILKSMDLYSEETVRLLANTLQSVKDMTTIAKMVDSKTAEDELKENLMSIKSK